MAFPDDVIEQAWRRAGEKYECERSTHAHWLKCNKPLKWERRGDRGDIGCWETNHRDRNTSNNALSNCEILCCSCHELTF